MNTDKMMEILIAILFALSLTSCSDVNPQVSVLKSFGESLLFKTKSLSTSSLDAVVLEASCNSFASQIELSLDSGATWIPAQTYDSTSTGSCNNGKFKLTLSKQKAPWDSMAISFGQSLPVKFRIQPKEGHFFYQDLQVLYSPPGTRSQEILVGSSVQSGGGFILKSRLRTQQQSVATGGNFKIYGRILE